MACSINIPLSGLKQMRSEMGLFRVRKNSSRKQERYLSFVSTPPEVFSQVE